LLQQHSACLSYLCAAAVPLPAATCSCLPLLPQAALAAMDEAAKLERVKQKRRESASRSRARKNAYMKELEVCGTRSM
jgi:hypothetical protein